jgi:uncharacterized protein YbaP (TraB family)
LWLALVLVPAWTAAEAAAPAPRLAFSEGTLWGITSATGATSQLLGTLHIGEPQQLRVPAPVWAAIRQARQVLVELADDAIDAGRLESVQTLPSGLSLRSMIEPAEWAALVVQLHRVGVEPARAERLTPWMASVLLEMGSRVPARSLDDRIVDLARSAGIEVRSLERQEDQFAVFDCVGLSDHLLMLREALQMPAAFFDELNDEVIELYAQQRVEAMVQRLTEAVPHSPPAGLAANRLTECTIDRRNARFVQALEPSLQAGGVFVAIGAAHLSGEQGVLALLRARGFGVQRLPVPPAASAPAAAVMESAP